MRHLIFVSAMIAAWLCNPAAHAAAPAECFANPGAVFAAHPDATHASYIVRGKRCWFADAFKKDAKATASAPRPVAAATRSRPATAAPAPEPRTTAVAPTVMPAVMQFPKEMPPAIQIAIHARELSRLSPDDDAPADFESRFSVSGYKVRR